MRGIDIMRRFCSSVSLLLKNGTFDTDTSNWTVSGCNATVSAGAVTLANNAITGFIGIYQGIPTVSGATYKVTYDLTNGTATGKVSANNSPGSTFSDVGASSATGVAQSFTFVATATTTYIQLELTVSFGTGKTATFDNVSVVRVG